MIRIAETSDLEYIQEIYNYEILNGTSTFFIDVKTYDEMLLWFNDHKDPYRIIVFEDKGKVVGFASLSKYREQHAFKSSVELSVYVNVKHRGKKIGHKLMTDILMYAKENPIIHTVISVITSENIISLEIHKNFGFKHCGTIKDAGFKFGRYLGIDTLQIIYN